MLAWMRNWLRKWLGVEGLHLTADLHCKRLNDHAEVLSKVGERLEEHATFLQQYDIKYEQISNLAERVNELRINEDRAQEGRAILFDRINHIEDFTKFHSKKIDTIESQFHKAAMNTATGAEIKRVCERLEALEEYAKHCAKPKKPAAPKKRPTKRKAKR